MCGLAGRTGGAGLSVGREPWEPRRCLGGRWRGSVAGVWPRAGWSKRARHAAWAGNRTRASRVAGENSTTEPPMLPWPPPPDALVQLVQFEQEADAWPKRETPGTARALEGRADCGTVALRPRGTEEDSAHPAPTCTPQYGAAATRTRSPEEAGSQTKRDPSARVNAHQGSPSVAGAAEHRRSLQSRSPDSEALWRRDI